MMVGITESPAVVEVQMYFCPIYPWRRQAPQNHPAYISRWPRHLLLLPFRCFPATCLVSAFYIHLRQSRFYELPHFQGGTPWSIFVISEDLKISVCACAVLDDLGCANLSNVLGKAAEDRGRFMTNLRPAT